MKKFVALFLVICLLLVFSSCSKPSENYMSYISDFNESDIIYESISEETPSKEEPSSKTETSSEAKTSSQTTTSYQTVTSSETTTSSETEVPTESKEDLLPLGEGNSYSNIINSQGRIAYKDNWIFYSNYSDNNALYKMNEDGTCNQRIGDDTECAYINVVGDWIFYKCKSTDFKSMPGFTYYDIAKIRIDGSERTKLWTTYSVSSIYIRDRNLFYTFYTNTNNYLGVKNLETGQFTEYTDENYYMPYMDGDWIYYLDSYNSSNRYGNLCKKHIGTGEKIQLTENKARKFSIYDGWVYYTDFNFSIRRVRIDGTQDSLIFSDGYIDAFNISNGAIYANGRGIFKIGLADSNYTKFDTYVASELHFTVTNNFIYYEAAPDGIHHKMYKIKKDGTENQLAQINVL